MKKQVKANGKVKGKAEVKTEGIKIGLEIHGYLLTKEKLFCTCKAVRHGALLNIKPNTFICPVCTGQPGAKPMLPNEEAIRKVVAIGLMLGCKINTTKNNAKLVWQRKHYDWPDMPKGYQITMSGAYSMPIAEKGNFEGINIRSVHIEEDPAAWDPETGSVDYNRSGLPLVEIVTEPEFSNSKQVADWLKYLVLTLSYIKALDKSAGIKVDVNVSTKGERVEIKNLSSIESIAKAIDYEIERQRREEVKRETRRWDEAKGITVVMRAKELAEDYRFIPDPDLPVLKLSIEEVEKIKRALPETPKQKLQKLIKTYKIDAKSAAILSSNLELVEFFEVVSKDIPADFALPWITVELLRVLNYNKKRLDEVNIKPEHFVELLELVREKKITPLKAKSLLNEFIPNSFSIKQKLELGILSQIQKISDAELEAVCKEVIAKNQKAVADYKAGKPKALDFLMGEVMKASNRRADYKKAKQILLKLLEF